MRYSSDELMDSHIEQYLNLGFSLVPVKYRDKRPLIKWEALMQRKLTESEIRHYWAAQSNVGIVTGSISNLAVIDFDDINTYYTFETTWGEVNSDLELDTMTVRTGKGIHLYFRPDIHAKTTTFRYNGMLHHLKQEGGYVVAPPSVHPSGATYQIEHRSTLPQEIEGARVIKTLIAMGVEEPSTQRKERPAAWASDLCDNIPEGERNTSAAQLCGLLIRKFPYDEGLVLGLMLAWNDRFCSPTLAEAEIHQLVEGEVERYGPSK